MAKELLFNLCGATYGSTPIKLERKKLYGWTSLVATSRNGDVCNSAYLSPDDALIIPSGGLKLGTVNEDGCWIEKSDLTAYSEDGAQVLPLYPSSFDASIELNQKATAQEFLDNEWESVYKLANADLSAAVGDDIYRFCFSYRGGTNLNDAIVWKVKPRHTIDAAVIGYTMGDRGVRDMMYSSDEQQIRELLANEIAANVKKGWEEITITAKAA